MRIKVEKWDDSLVVRIPSLFADVLGLQRGAVVELQLGGSGLSMAPVPITSPNLDALLELITPENLHSEIGVGDRVGHEA